MNLAIFLSGQGSDFLAIAKAIEKGSLNAKIVLVASNKNDAPGLIKAGKLGFPTVVFDRKSYANGKLFAKYMLDTLQKHDTGYIILAGYLRKIPPSVLRVFKKKVFNIHPALLPKYGGKGMYGLNVHRAVIEAGDKESGVSIHEVDTEYDTGKVIAQSNVPVLPGDTPESLAARVLETEHEFYPKVLQDIIKGRIKV